MKRLLELAERGRLPDALIRAGIRLLDRSRLAAEARPDVERELAAKQEFLARMRAGPVAHVPEMANIQHYEVPPEFFTQVLGKNLKYSGCLWPAGTDSLDAAEDAMLALTVRRAGIVDGMRILELGCGWGSLTLWMAARFPESRITAVSNSAPQGRFIRAAAAERGLANVEVVTADMNDFDAGAPIRPGGDGGDVRAHAQLAACCSSASTGGSTRGAGSSSTSSPTAATPTPSRPRARTTGWGAISSPAA